MAALNFVLWGVADRPTHVEPWQGQVTGFAFNAYQRYQSPFDDTHPSDQELDRDLALSFAGDDEAKRDYMRACLQRAKREGVRRRDLPAWLEREAAGYAEPG